MQARGTFLPMNKPEAIFFAGHSHAGSAIGGAHRTRQLVELLGTSMNLRHADFKDEDGHRFGNYFRGLPVGLQEPMRWLTAPSSIGRAGAAQRLVDSALAKYPGSELCLWENTGRQAIGKYIKLRGKKLVAFPQNLESLALSGRLTDTLQPNNLESEAMALAQADLVVTISQEEQWLMANYGVSTLYLPYFPPSDLKTRFEQVRRLRSAREKTEVLILGSATYPPSELSLRRFLSAVTIIPKVLRDRFILAGNGTTKLASEANAAGVRCAGALSDADLDQILARCRAVVLWQNQGAGALTRVAEMLLAGVPIIANSIALRSARHYEGTFACEAVEEIPELLSTLPDIVPEPPYPSRAVHRIRRAVENLLCR